MVKKGSDVGVGANRQVAAMIRWLPALLCMAGIFYSSHQTGYSVNRLLPFFQTFVPSMTSFDWGHYVSYFSLALTFLWALHPHKPNWRIGCYVVLLCVLYGITDEYHQQFVANRKSDWMDVRNDGIGAAIAMLFMLLPPMKKFYERIYLQFNRSCTVRKPGTQKRDCPFP